MKLKAKEIMDLYDEIDVADCETWEIKYDIEGDKDAQVDAVIFKHKDKYYWREVLRNYHVGICVEDFGEDENTKYECKEVKPVKKTIVVTEYEAI